MTSPSWLCQWQWWWWCAQPTPNNMQMKRRYDVVIDRKAGTTRRILDDIHGHIEAGSLVALMGPSGAGKTTLLNTLAQRDSGGSVRSLARSFVRSLVRLFVSWPVGRSVGWSGGQWRATGVCPLPRQCKAANVLCAWCAQTQTGQPRNIHPLQWARGARRDHEPVWLRLPGVCMNVCV